MVLLYNGIQQHVKPVERLVLLAWLDDLLGYESNRALLTDLKGATEGFHAAGCNFIDHHLIVRGDEAELRELREREDDEEALSDERHEQLQRKLERARLKLSMPEHREEIRRVKELLALARRIRVGSKAQELRQFVRGVLDKAPQEKLLIFTEYTDTLDYLRDEVLRDFGPIAQIYGSMSLEERQAEEETFQQPDVHLMLPTDAAGEGINLQFCHLMINYELPWNPNRIEQRIGRLHRYGQEHEVRVYNMQVINTREGIILMRLLEKLKTIERQLGGYAPNILGLTTRDVGINMNRLSDLIMNAIAEDTPPEVTAAHLEQVWSNGGTCMTRSKAVCSCRCRSSIKVKLIE